MLVLSRGGHPGVPSSGGHPGVDSALKLMISDGTLRQVRHAAVPLRADPAEVAALWARHLAYVREQATDFIVLHHFHDNRLPDPQHFILDAQVLPHRPAVAFSGGDAFYNGFFRPSHPTTFKSAAGAVDLVLNTSMGPAADAISRYGAPRVALWPAANCQVRFPMPTEAPRPAAADFDVCFIGSNNRSRNPLRGYYWYGRQREALVKSLSRRFGPRFAVFGNGWQGLQGSQGPSSFASQMETCRRAKVVVGGVPYSPARYYLSNRPFMQIASGVPFVDVSVEGVDRILRDGEHWHLADAPDRVGDKVDELLCRSDQQRQEMGMAAALYVSAKHTDEQRWRGLLKTLAALRTAIVTNQAPRAPELEFLLPEVDVAAELRLATRGYDADG